MHIVTFIFIIIGSLFLLQFYRRKKYQDLWRKEKKSLNKNKKYISPKRSSLENLLEKSFEWPQTFGKKTYETNSDFRLKNQEKTQQSDLFQLNCSKGENKIRISHDFELERLLKKIH